MGATTSEKRTGPSRMVIPATGVGMYLLFRLPPENGWTTAAVAGAGAFAFTLLLPALLRLAPALLGAVLRLLLAPGPKKKVTAKK